MPGRNGAGWGTGPCSSAGVRVDAVDRWAEVEAQTRAVVSAEEIARGLVVRTQTINRLHGRLGLKAAPGLQVRPG
jgi:hypothetical protein